MNINVPATAKDTNTTSRYIGRQQRVDIPAMKSFKRAGSGTFGGATTLDDDNNNETAEKKSVCALLRLDIAVVPALDPIEVGVLSV